MSLITQTIIDLRGIIFSGIQSALFTVIWFVRICLDWPSRSTSLLNFVYSIIKWITINYFRLDDESDTLSFFWIYKFSIHYRVIHWCIFFTFFAVVHLTSRTYICIHFLFPIIFCYLPNVFFFRCVQEFALPFLFLSQLLRFFPD